MDQFSPRRGSDPNLSKVRVALWSKLIADANIARANHARRESGPPANQLGGVITVGGE